MNPILLYSGGVDSLVTLNHLLEEDYKPFIYHFQTTKLKPYHEEMVKTNLRRLYPTNAYYVFSTETKNYHASVGEHGEYYVKINEETNKHVNEYGHPIAAGYFKKNHKSVKRIITDIEIYNHDYILPLKDMDFDTINEIWETLPTKVKKHTLSSTRYYPYGGKIIKGLDDKDE